MHEMALTGEILKVVLQFAEENLANRVLTVQLRIGVMRDFSEEWIQRYFDYLSRDTAAESAKIQIERVPVTVYCSCCDITFHTSAWQEKTVCPSCSDNRVRLSGGDEFTIESIGVI